MKIRIEPLALKDVVCDVIVLGVVEGQDQLPGDDLSFDQSIGGSITRLISDGDFTGKLNETTVVYLTDSLARKLVLVGLGKADKMTAETVRQAAGSGLRLATKGKVKSVGMSLMCSDTLAVGTCAQVMTEGAMLASYRYDKLKSDAKPAELEEIVLAIGQEGPLASTKAGAARGRIMADATMLARDLVNAPGNMMTPTDMAEVAKKIASDTGLHCDIMEESDMKRLGMGALLGVSQGSAQPAKLIVLKHEGNEKDDVLALVGKGLTFDSGGISIKPSDGMHLMKNDMSGGAAVLGAMQAIGHLKPERSVLGIVVCSENLPSGTALKPGDVITAMNGKTIEIISTDAEGRLILADAVAYANSLGAKRIVDAATLTGACGIALGPNIYSAIVANDGDLVAAIQDAASLTGERFWQMPGDDDYKELFKGTVADLQNAGGRLGGVMTGGLFIGEFAGGTPWAHLDIAPTSYTDKEKHYQAKGGTGVAVRTLAELACLK